MSEQEIFEKVKKIVAETLDIQDPDKITMESCFLQDLGADSLETFDLVYYVEQEFGRKVPDDLLREIETVGDVVKWLNEELKN